MKTLGQRLAVVGVLVVTAATLPIIRPAPGPEIRHRSLPLAFEQVRTAQSAGTEPTWTSDPVDTPFPFSLVGVRWTGPLDAEIQIRTATGDDWARWESVELLDAAPDPDSPEDKGISSTEPMWVGSAEKAQVRTIGGEPPSDLELQIVDPGPDPGGNGLSQAQAAPSKPGIISRAGWGADESMRSCCPRYASTVKVAFVHHTVTSNSYSPSESDDIVRSIYAYHTQTNGWDDIGYNFLVDRYGQIFEGRAGGVDRPVIGAHAQGFNTGSTGIAALGTFSSSEPPQATLDAIANLTAWRMDVHHVDPAGQTQMTSGGSRKYPEGQVVTLNRVSGHRDTQDTSCPGDRLYSKLGWLRTTSHDIGKPKSFDPSASPNLFTPDGDGKQDTTRYTARTTGGNWTVKVLDPGNNERRRWQGSGTNVDLRWDGRDSTGRALGHGEYRFRIDVVDSNGWARPAHTPVTLFREPWGPWGPVGGAIGGAAHPEVVTTPDGKVHALVRGPEGGLHHATWSNGNWGTWNRLGGVNAQSHPDSTLGWAAGHDGTLHAVVRGNDSRLYHGTVSPTGAFSGWSRVGPPNAHGRDPVLVTASDGAVHLMVVGGKDYLYDNVWSGGWRGWVRVGSGHANGTSPRLAAGPDGSVLAIVIGGNDGIYSSLLRGGPRSWSRVGAAHNRGLQPDLTRFANGYAIAVRGMNGGIYSATGNHGAWGVWSRVGNGNDDGFTPDLVGAPNGELLVNIRGMSGTIYTNARHPGEGWTRWRSTGSTSADGRVPTSTTRGSDTVFLVVQRDAGPPLGTIGKAPFAAL